MAQIQKGDTFADGQQVTGARLNQLIDSATILPNIITDQTNLTANTVTNGDSILLYDLSATALREATASDLLNSNIPITTASVTAGIGSDLTLSPQDGTIVNSASYVGTTTSNTVTSNAHGLTAGQVVAVSSATGSQYNGTYRIASVTTNTFIYNLGTTVTAGSGTLSYTKQGSVRNIEHEVINGNLYVDGNAIIAGTTVQTGSVTQNGIVTQNNAVTMNSTLSVTGTTTLTGETIANGNVTANANVTANGTVNVTGVIQYNGTPVYGMYEIVKYTTNPSPSLTKGADEIWLVNAVGYGGSSPYGTPSLVITGTTTILGDVKETVDGRNSGGDPAFDWSYSSLNANFIIPVGTTFTSKTFSGNWLVITITKYKTA